MTEHPMITAQRLAENTIPLQTSVTGAAYRHNMRKTGMVAALQWLSDPANLSDELITNTLGRLNEQDIVFHKQTVSLIVKALIKEIEGHEKGGAS